MNSEALVSMLRMFELLVRVETADSEGELLLARVLVLVRVKLLVKDEVLIVC